MKMKAILKGGKHDGLELDVSSGAPFVEVPTFTNAERARPIRDEDAKPKFGEVKLTITLDHYMRGHGTENGAAIYRHCEKYTEI